MFVIICHSFQLFFQDFVIGLSVLARGSIQDKLRWTFSLYDINGDGIITKDELSRIIGSIYDLMGKSVEPIVEESTAKEHVDKLFEVNVLYEILMMFCKEK